MRESCRRTYSFANVHRFSFKTKANLMSQSHVDYLLNTGIRDACRPVVYTRIRVYMEYTHVVFRYVCELVGI